MNAYHLRASALLAVGAAVGLSGSASAATTCHTKTWKTVTHPLVRVVVKHRVHGKLVPLHTKYGKVVIKKVRVAGTVTHHKRVCFTTTTTPAATPSVAPAPAPTRALRASLDPSFTQDAKNPLKLTFSVSAAAQQTDAKGVVSQIADLPTGVLEFFVDGSLADTLNVGGSVAGGDVTTTVAGFGTHHTTLVYVSGDQSATTGDEPIDVEPLPTLATLTDLAVDQTSCVQTTEQIGVHTVSFDDCSYVATSHVTTIAGDPVGEGFSLVDSGGNLLCSSGGESCGFHVLTARGPSNTDPQCPTPMFVKATFPGDLQYGPSSSPLIPIANDTFCAA